MKIFHRKIWHKTYKHFGWEVLDIRYGGVLMGIDTARERIGEYLRGEIDKLEELEEEGFILRLRMVVTNILG